MLVELQEKIKELEDRILKEEDPSITSNLLSHVGDLKKMINMQIYINLLAKELEETVPIAYVHGWRSTNYETGASLRNLIYGEVSMNNIEDDAAP